MMGIFDWLNKKEDEKIEEDCITRKADFSSFKEVTDYIYELSGIIDLDKRALTSSRLQQYAISQDIHTTTEFLAKMKSSKEFDQEVINIATVNETFFMRELKELEWLIGHIKRSEKRLKILSMPSSSGEEIYSILLLMLQRGVDLNRVEISGYDINSNAVQNAIKGEYDEHSLHKIDEHLRTKYFNKNEENHFEIIEMIKNSVKFEQKNIFDLANEKSKYDVILSRNMFIYFDDEKRELALNIISNLLKTNGIYIKGHADHIKNHPNLENIEYGIYKKR